MFIHELLSVFENFGLLQNLNNDYYYLFLKKSILAMLVSVIGLLYYLLYQSCFIITVYTRV